MFSIPQGVLHQTRAVVNRVESGLLINYDVHGQEHLWIGTPVSTAGDGTFFSPIPPDHEICTRAAAWPFVRWKFYDAESDSHLVVDGTAAIIPGPLWQRINRNWTLEIRQPFTALITTIDRVRQVMSDDGPGCRQVLPSPLVERQAFLRDSFCLERSSQTSLCF
ncbi:MAG: hypothetical protein ACR2OZ_01235 [Verrucomicrobiales bacterium]